MIGREFLHQCCEPIILTGFSRHSTTQLFALRYDWLILIANAFLLKLTCTLFEIGIFHLLRVQSLFHSFFFADQNKREGKHVLTNLFLFLSVLVSKSPSKIKKGKEFTSPSSRQSGHRVKRVQASSDFQ